MRHPHLAFYVAFAHCFLFYYSMRQTFRSWLGSLLVLLLPALSGYAQSADSVRFIRHTLHLNLTQGIRQEVQFSYERTFNPTVGVEVVLGARIPSSRNYYRGSSFGIVGGYDERVFPLPYENGFLAGAFFKGSFSRTERREFAPFYAFGFQYQYGFFNDKCYGELKTLHTPAFGQEFSLRKQDVSARVQFGVRRHFYLPGGKPAFSTEVSAGLGVGERSGKFLDVRRHSGSTSCPPDAVLDRPIEPKTTSFKVTMVVFPINIKIGYSWGG